MSLECMQYLLRWPQNLQTLSNWGIALDLLCDVMIWFSSKSFSTWSPLMCGMLLLQADRKSLNCLSLEPIFGQLNYKRVARSSVQCLLCMVVGFIIFSVEASFHCWACFTTDVLLQVTQPVCWICASSFYQCLETCTPLEECFVCSLALMWWWCVCSYLISLQGNGELATLLCAALFSLQTSPESASEYALSLAAITSRSLIFQFF